MAGNIYPYNINQTLNWKVRNFPDDVYSFTASDYLTTLMSILLGNTGTGQLSTVQISSKINQQYLEFSDLDDILGNLLKAPRLPSETYSTNSNPFTDQIPVSYWYDIIEKDASYRSRLNGIASALMLGATKFGLQKIAEATSNSKIKVVEVWNTPTVVSGGVTIISGTSIATRGFGANEIVLIPQLLPDVPYDNNIKAAIFQTAEQIKPINSVITIASGQTSFIQAPYLPNGTTSGTYSVASGNSTYFYLNRGVIGNKINIPTYVNNNTDQTVVGRYWLRNNQLTQAPYFAHLQTQEEIIDVTQNISNVTITTTTTQQGYSPPTATSTTSLLASPILRITSTVYGAT